MFAKNVVTFLAAPGQRRPAESQHQDEITRDTLIAQDGQVVNEQIRELLGLGEREKTYHTRNRAGIALKVIQPPAPSASRNAATCNSQGRSPWK